MTKLKRGGRYTLYEIVAYVWGRAPYPPLFHLVDPVCRLILHHPGLIATSSYIWRGRRHAVPPDPSRVRRKMCPDIWTMWAVMRVTRPRALRAEALRMRALFVSTGARL